MRKNRISKFITLCMCLSLLFPASVKAEDLTYGKVLDELAAAQKELADNQAAIDNKQHEVNTNNAKINSLKSEIKQMGDETVKLQQEIVDSNNEINEKQDQTKDLASYLQMSGGDNLYLEYIFGGETMTDFIYRSAIVEQITEYNEEMIKELQDLIKANEDRKKELAAKQEEYEKKMTELNNEISKLNADIKAIGGLAPSLEQQVKDKQTLVEFYKSQGCTSRSQVIGVDCAKNVSNAGFVRPMTQGYVTSHVSYRWGSFHRGIDLGSAEGRNTKLYSIGNGTITNIYQDSYGANCIIIQYRTVQGEYYSALYAHLSSYAPGLYVGKTVNSNTLIGYMGDTGYAFGVHLHLEVYPCRIYSDSECSTWNKYVAFAERKFNEGYKGAASVINFPAKTYQTWYTR